MSSNVMINFSGVSKLYRTYDKPRDRLKQFFWRGNKTFYHDFFALQDITFEVHQGENLGIIGLNGAGKSTLLKMASGILSPSHGSMNVNGRVAALLELGSGFNPEFTGEENIYMNAAILGLSKSEVEEKYESIVAFADIGAFIHQPVRTYSSGMTVRLAFAIAVTVEPDILIIDEALSVGDGAFSRKSFERIMALKNEGRTLCFCSHSMYQVEQLCDRVLWLDKGVVRMFGDAETVIKAYNEFLNSQIKHKAPSLNAYTPPIIETGKNICFSSVKVSADGVVGKSLLLTSGKTVLGIEVLFKSDLGTPIPSVAVCIVGSDGRVITSCSTFADGIELMIDEQTGVGQVVINFPDYPLLRGDYSVDVYLMCEKGILLYEAALSAAKLQVVQEGVELGVVSIPHSWHQPVQERALS